MTVPPLFGWQDIVALLLLLLLVAVAFFVASAAGRAPSGRTEFQAWLDARSSRPLDTEADRPGVTTGIGAGDAAAGTGESRPH